MGQEKSLIHRGLRAPRAAAVAGMLFGVLLIRSQLLVWISIPANLGVPAVDVISHSKAISLALNLHPFAGIAFLWFIAVVRNRLGALEDRFFATVFFGSGVLYVPMVFTSAALAGGLIRVLIHAPEILTQTDAYALARSRPSLSSHERVRYQDGWRFHVLARSDSGCPTLKKGTTGETRGE